MCCFVATLNHVVNSIYIDIILFDLLHQSCSQVLVFRYGTHGVQLQALSSRRVAGAMEVLRLSL